MIKIKYTELGPSWEAVDYLYKQPLPVSISIVVMLICKEIHKFAITSQEELNKLIKEHSTLAQNEKKKGKGKDKADEGKINATLEQKSKEILEKELTLNYAKKISIKDMNGIDIPPIHLAQLGWLIDLSGR